MRKYFVSFFIMFFLVVNSQDVDNDSLVFFKIKNYQIHRNIAEISIVRKNLKLAKEEYEIAFEIFEKPNSVDLYNCFIVNLEINNFKDAVLIYNKLYCLNFDFEVLKTNTNFKKFREYCNKNKISYDIECNSKVNNELKSKLNDLFQLDQIFRKKGNYTFYKDSINKYDSINAFKLKKIIDDYGFPNEYDLGVNDKQNFFDYQDFYFIIWHQLKNNKIGKQKFNFSDILYKATFEGKINPLHAYQLINLNNGNNAREIQIINIEVLENNEDIKSYISKKYIKEKRSLKEQEEINLENIDREKLGLCSVDDEIEKMFFSNNNKLYKFQKTSIATFQFLKEENLGDLRNGLIELFLKK